MAWDLNSQAFLVGVGCHGKAPSDSPCTFSQWWRSCLGGLQRREMACWWHKQSPASDVWSAEEEPLLRPWSWWLSYRRGTRRKKKQKFCRVRGAILCAAQTSGDKHSGSQRHPLVVHKATSDEKTHGYRKQWLCSATQRAKWPTMWCRNPEGAAGNKQGHYVPSASCVHFTSQNRHGFSHIRGTS